MAIPKKKVLIISFSKLNSDPRVYRQIANLKDDYQVTAAGISSPELTNVKFIQISERKKTLVSNAKRAFLLKSLRFDGYYRETFEYEGLLSEAKNEPYDLIIANDIDSLPLAFMISDGSNIIHDAHEYAPRQYEDDFKWRFFMMRYRDRLCQRYLRRCKAMITVSEGIAQEYERQYGVRSEVISNATEYLDIAPSAVLDNRVRLIHHGSAHRARKIEKMIEMMKYLDDRFSLDLMLMPTDRDYYRFLWKKAEGMSNVTFRDPVPMKEIVRTANQYDVGVYIFEPTNFNSRFALPNKLFEFIQSRLAVAIGPSYEMEKIVRHYDCGVVAKDFEPCSLANKLGKLNRKRIEYFKEQCGKAAMELSSEANMLKLKKTVQECLSRSP